jgi:Protein of unknown function (DUF3102)
MSRTCARLKKATTLRTQTKTRKQWAAEINALHTQTERKAVAGIINEGRMLIAAKKALDHGEFEKMIERELPYGASMAQFYMKIARDPRFRKAKHVRLLPAAVGVLVELSRLTDQEFKAALEAGKLHPKMTRADVVTVKVRHYTQRIEATGYVRDPQPEPEPTCHVPRPASGQGYASTYPPDETTHAYDTKHPDDDDDDAQPSDTPPLSIVQHIEPLSIVERIEGLLTEASLDQHGEATMAFDARQPGYAAQLRDWLNARLAL